jgi:general secretion pathway protein F
VITHVRSGKPLADALEQEGALTQVGYNLIRSGEKAGQVAAMVASLAKLYDDGARSRMKNVLSLVEPLSILLIGAVIGLLVIGVMLAITSVNLQVV